MSKAPLLSDQHSREKRAHSRRGHEVKDPNSMFWRDIEEAARRVNSGGAQDVTVIHVAGKAKARIERGAARGHVVIYLHAT